VLREAFHEIDKAARFEIKAAKDKANPGHVVFLDDLLGVVDPPTS
jgi:predicted NUDIX family NTP pyrophosphohydrolase